MIEFLVARIEGSLRELLDVDLALYPPDKWKSNGWDFIDSIDPKREWDGWAYVDIPNPDKGEEGYPRLQIENRIYSSRVFRKIHLEVAWRQDGLQVLHIVMYPRYDLPTTNIRQQQEQVLDVFVSGSCHVQPAHLHLS